MHVARYPMSLLFYFNLVAGREPNYVVDNSKHPWYPSSIPCPHSSFSSTSDCVIMTSYVQLLPKELLKDGGSSYIRHILCLALRRCISCSTHIAVVGFFAFPLLQFALLSPLPLSPPHRHRDTLS
ncbi:hypothetical protein BDZ97DRAFT_117219 [Flammula alnicola]|nr:hypothetical protein BDZ97DRAFT_117219 [Flammula alnicola]